MPSEQNFANHAKFDPPFHFFLIPVFLINFVASVVGLVRHPSVDTGWSVLFAFALLLAIFKIRIYSLKVQDRVIRLEERLRLAGLLPASMHSKIADLTTGQMVALRFASDAEVPTLAERIFSGQLSTVKDIKKSIQNWRPDYTRV